VCSPVYVTVQLPLKVPQAAEQPGPPFFCSDSKQAQRHPVQQLHFKAHSCQEEVLSVNENLIYCGA